MTLKNKNFFYWSHLEGEENVSEEVLDNLYEDGILKKWTEVYFSPPLAGWRPRRSVQTHYTHQAQPKIIFIPIFKKGIPGRHNTIPKHRQ